MRAHLFKKNRRTDAKVDIIAAAARLDRPARNLVVSSSSDLEDTTYTGKALVTTITPDEVAHYFENPLALEDAKDTNVEPAPILPSEPAPAAVADGIPEIRFEDMLVIETPPDLPAASDNVGLGIFDNFELPEPSPIAVDGGPAAAPGADEDSHVAPDEDSHVAPTGFEDLLPMDGADVTTPKVLDRMQKEQRRRRLPRTNKS